MNELVTKILAMKADMEKMNVLAIRPNVNGRISVQVSDLKDIPNVAGVVYKHRKDEYFEYEKSVVVDDVEICAIGTKEDMLRDIAGEEK